MGVEIVILPTDGVTMKPADGTQVQGDLQVEWTGGTPDGDPYLILGEPGGSRLQAQQLIARAGVGFAWNQAAAQGEGTFKVGGEVKRGKLFISLADADGFIGAVLGGFELESDFDLGVGYSTAEGVFFTGSATLDIQVPLHVQLGPVELSALTITVGFAGDTFPLGLRANLKAALGPLQGVIEQVGIGADLTIRQDQGGNAGPLDFRLKFLPPKGVGLSLDVGVVKGGGFLSIDPDRGEYAGALELALFDVVTIKAIGIITTKMPDGSPGFSLLIIMSVEFGSGIQLGFGFTLSAVGGLVGLNRTMNLQALAEGIRTGAIESVMFPKDVIANAPKIISDLRDVLPAAAGHLPDRPDGEDRLGHADAGQHLARRHHRDPRQHRDRRHPQGRDPGRRRRADRPAGQLHRRDRVRQEAHLVLRRAVRVADRVPDDRRRDGPAGRVRRRRQLRRERRRIPPAVLAAAAAVPEPASASPSAC